MGSAASNMSHASTRARARSPSIRVQPRTGTVDDDNMSELLSGSGCSDSDSDAESLDSDLLDDDEVAYFYQHDIRPIGLEKRKKPRSLFDNIGVYPNHITMAVGNPAMFKSTNLLALSVAAMERKQVSICQFSISVHVKLYGTHLPCIEIRYFVSGWVLDSLAHVSAFLWQGHGKEAVQGVIRGGRGQER